MRTKLFKIAQAATLGLAITFTLSCSSGDGGGSSGGNSSGDGGSGSGGNNCGGLIFNTDTKFCFKDEIYTKCGGKIYNPTEQGCENNVLAPKCGTATYDQTTHFCYNNNAYEKCDGMEYKPATQYCAGGIIHPLDPAERFLDNRDGKTYKYVTIGTQKWMAENLNYNASGSKCYSNSDANCTKYGRLYTWATAKTVCPSGWYLPSDAEWRTLEGYVGSNAGTKLKAASGWGASSNSNGTDDYGFSALPGGYGKSDGSFTNAGGYGYWWSSTEYDADSAYGRGMDYDDASVFRYNRAKSLLYSVRCVQGSDPAPTPSSSSIAQSSSSSLVISGTFIDSRDDKTYKYVTIGTQTWMAENLNLNYETYANQSLYCDYGPVTQYGGGCFEILNASECDTQWGEVVTICGSPSDKCYSNSDANCTKYGRLYDWAMAKTVCPSGWHLPSDDEWTRLTDYVGSNAGTKLKAKSGWNEGGNGTDDYGFSALPGGGGDPIGDFDDFGYDGVGYRGDWWSSTEPNAVHTISRYMDYDDANVYRNFNDKKKAYLRSVRCVQD
jgi:uncharacterized protein (TIGR02145 family)